ncbi:protein prune homolog 2 isoform X2 [Phlebotomus argentipes]|uniref:protein prune homolog 2 isoform X2 n=1 Tax=Phlebotomus argentipes TaxID=94469 RepID=UPI00289323FC|nr:protein prune homolog 2 isoform X2 [Phlebotomus argentipes]
MSQNLDSPGFAEAKMDISSETTSQSQESPGITSPDDDGNTFHQPCTAIVSEGNSSTRSGLTLTNSHPLMSPVITDSDSENGHKSPSKFAFPDVVPAKETTQRLKTPHTSTPNKASLWERKVNSTLTAKLSSLDIVDNPCGRKKVSKDLSPDRMASSGSEQDLSQYHASVTPSFQSVALVSRMATTSNDQRSQRKVLVPSDLLSDVSSVESLSNRSFDDAFDPNVLSGSPVSSLFDNNIFNDDDECVGREDPIDPSKQKIVLPDGRTREIDMKVIEPYKRVLSHGGYLKTAGQNAIIVFSACYLPDRSRTDYHYVMDSLFLYVVQTLEQLITDDYVMVYLHGGSCRSNVPPFHWLRKCYQLLDRRLRKRLKTLYMVHPTFWLKSLVLMSRPFISSKFWRKLIYVKNLEDLCVMVPVEKAAIPEKVKSYNTKCV